MAIARNISDLFVRIGSCVRVLFSGEFCGLWVTGSEGDAEFIM